MPALPGSRVSVDLKLPLRISAEWTRICFSLHIQHNWCRADEESYWHIKGYCQKSFSSFLWMSRVGFERPQCNAITLTDSQVSSSTSSSFRRQTAGSWTPASPRKATSVPLPQVHTVPRFRLCGPERSDAHTESEKLAL